MGKNKDNKKINNSSNFDLYPLGVVRYRPNFRIVEKEEESQDLIIIGGGIMGLMTAYYASLQGKKVTILEKSTIGNKQAASFSLTRSFRCDYIDPMYAKLAKEAEQLWKDLEVKSKRDLLIQCGCLNLVRKDITEDTQTTYGAKSFAILSKLKLGRKKFSKSQLKQTFPQFNAYLGYLDTNGGILYLPTITKVLLKLLEKQKVTIIENVTITGIKENKTNVTVVTENEIYQAQKLVITAGIWSNEILRLIENCSLQFPITPDRPSECKYFIPQTKDLSQFTTKNFPVFAYLDVGIYGHPIYIGRTPGVKISYYNPPDIERKNTAIKDVQSFVDLCIPSLKNARVVNVTNADQCSYDMVADKNFILGKLPSCNNIFVGTGWNGTGYKFAPLIGTIFSQLTITNKSSYDIKAFSPERFVQNEK